MTDTTEQLGTGIHTVAVPAYDPHDRCWAVMKIRYKRNPEVEICGLRPRPGCLTCNNHVEFEADAQRLKIKKGV
jgi:hypothetical protein